MQNETTVKASATLSYYAGALRAARAELERVENSAADYPASEFAGVVASYRAALAQAAKLSKPLVTHVGNGIDSLLR